MAKNKKQLSSNVFLPQPLYNIERKKSGVKVARPDIILDEESLSIDVMQDFIFAEIGGQELLDISRTDFINSPLNQSYSAVPGTGTNYIETNPIQFIDASPNIFESFSINIDNYVPTTTEAVTVDDTVKSLIINTINLKNGYSVEIQFFTNPDIQDGIIY